MRARSGERFFYLKPAGGALYSCFIRRPNYLIAGAWEIAVASSFTMVSDPDTPGTEMLVDFSLATSQRAVPAIALVRQPALS